MPRPAIIFDCDPGVDDALALLYLVGSGRADLLGVTAVYGNTDVRQAAENALRVLDIAASQAPVFVGSERPLLADFRPAHWVHGEDGLGNTNLPPSPRRPEAEHAVDFLIRTVRERPGEVTVVAVGPLTNLTLAVRQAPDLAEQVAGVVIMGGSAAAGGNRSPWGEANVSHDPHAARIVFEAGWPVTMVGLDATMSTCIRDEHLERLEQAATPVSLAARRIIDAYFQLYAGWLGDRRCPLHDPLAAGIALDPSFVTDAPLLPGSVETRGEFTEGMTAMDLRVRYNRRLSLRPARVRVVLGVDCERFVEDFMRVLTREART